MGTFFDFLKISAKIFKTDFTQKGQRGDFFQKIFFSWHRVGVFSNIK